MVNRRLLRIKAMKAYYAYKQSENSDYEIALDQIAEAYQPDLNSMLPQNLQKLEGLRQLSVIEFNEVIGRTKVDTTDETPIEVREFVQKISAQYYNKINATRNSLIKNVVTEVENLHKVYIKILLIINHLADIAKNSEENRKLKTNLLDFGRLSKNAMVMALQNHEGIDQLRIKYDADWKTEHLLVVRQFYVDVLRKDDLYKKYCQQKSSTIQEDIDLVVHIYKNLIFRESIIKEYFEERDINWTENKSTVRSLSLKTIEVTDLKDITIQKLAYNWEEDRVFFQDLFKKSILADTELEPIVNEKIQNWDEDRVAMLDMILIKMALTEMINFANIPVKVTINEYIELAKTYSTPNSGRFVNGLLDIFAQEWQKTGKIKKSGRGLIDNR